MKEKPEIICELTVAGVDMETLQPEHSLTVNNSTLSDVKLFRMSLLIVNLGSVCLSRRILLQTLIVKVHLPERRTGSDFQSHTYHL